MCPVRLLTISGFEVKALIKSPTALKEARAEG